MRWRHHFYFADEESLSSALLNVPRLYPLVTDRCGILTQISGPKYISFHRAVGEFLLDAQEYLLIVGALFWIFEIFCSETSGLPMMAQTSLSGESSQVFFPAAWLAVHI